MTERRRFKQTEPLQDRLAAFAAELRDKASSLMAGAEKDDLLRPARMAETTCPPDGWANSPGLRPPR
jgi:hypothetical protein